MKKAFLASLSLLLPSLLFSYCSMPVTLANANIPCASGLSSDPSRVHAYLWLQSKADWTTDNTGTGANAPGTCTGGCDSDGMDVMDEECLFLGTSILGQWQDCMGSGTPDEYYLLTDWSTSPTGIGFDGCPSADSYERAILLIYDDDGKYVLQSRSQGKVWENWDEIGTSAADLFSAQFSYSCGSGDGPIGLCWSGDEGANQVDIYLAALPNSILNGNYAAGDAPSTQLVTGFRLYFYVGCTPTSLSTTEWTAGLSYPVNTGYISNCTLPSSTNGLWISRALIIDGKELPFVSSNYISALPEHFGGFDDYDLCACNSMIIWTEYSDFMNYTQDVLMDGSELFICVVCDPCSWPLTCNVEHTIQFRSRMKDYDIVSCWSDPVVIIDHDNSPTPPVITSITDNDPDALTGVTITYTPGLRASRHDLIRDGTLIQSGFVSGSTITGLNCNGSHNFVVEAISDQSCDSTFSESHVGTDYCSLIPSELAPGATSGDALIFSNDKTTASWPSYTGATGYRLYRGTQADLANLPGGTVDNSCLKYDGTATSIVLSGDAPASGSFFWYLVNAYNGAGEGPAGPGRIISSSGGCP